MDRHTAWLSLVLVLLIAQLVPRVAEAQSSRSASTGWTAPRTADGRPDLEGVWENNSATPLERPAQFANKPRLSDEELANLERRARELFGPETDAIFGDGLYLALLAQKPAPDLGATGTYSQNWLPDRYFEHRTSLIEDPANGRLPPATAEGQRARQASVGRFGRPAASAQEMSIQDPKILVAIICGGVYSFALLARRTIGWSGRRAAWLSALAFVIVLLNFVPIGYFLTKSHNF